MFHFYYCTLQKCSHENSIWRWKSLFNRRTLLCPSIIQPADQGAITATDGVLFNVQHVTKTPAGVIEHHGHFEDDSLTTDSLAVGTKVNLNIDKERRILNARNHTAGHLLDYALDAMTPSYQLIGGNGYHFPEGNAVLSSFSIISLFSWHFVMLRYLCGLSDHFVSS